MDTQRQVGPSGSSDGRKRRHGLDAQKPETEKGKRLSSKEQNDLNVALLSAAWAGKRLLVTQFINACADIESKDDDGRTPLLIAAEEGYAQICTLLIENGANMGAKDNTHGLDAIGWAELGRRDGRHAKTAAFLKFAAYMETSMGKDGFRTFLSYFRKCIS